MACCQLVHKKLILADEMYVSCSRIDLYNIIAGSHRHPVHEYITVHTKSCIHACNGHKHY